MRLDGAVALVVGIDTEVGEAIASRFVAEGARVAGCPAPSSRQPATAPDVGGPVAIFQGDICTRAGARAVVDQVVARFGSLTVLVNYGAARRVLGTVLDITDEEFDEEMTSDLKSVIALASAAIPEMERAGGGAIVNLSSIAAAGLKGRALRSTSKAALATLTRSMALDHAHQGIRANALLVGPTLTSDIVNRPDRARMEQEAPLGRLHTPEDVANAVLFLASDEARSITGVHLTIDAGRSLPSW